MDGKLRLATLFLLFSPLAYAQMLQPIVNDVHQSGLVPITLDASCTGSSSGLVYAVGCSSAMTVTAGDAIECVGSGFDFGAFSSFITDNLNGTYDTIRQAAHPGSSNSGYITAVFQNSAAGSITPQIASWEPDHLGISCRAFKNTRTSLVVDGGSVNQANTQTASNPTSGTAAAPTNDNELVVGSLTYAASQTVTNAAGWTPAGTLTAFGEAGNYPSYDHYQIQTTATAVNSPFTSASAQYVDTQFAILNAANPAGYRALTGIFGVPAISKTNGVTVTAADLNGSTTTLASTPKNTGWTLSGGTGGTYNTSINPVGTGKIIVQGVSHTFGDAGTSIQMAGGDSTSNWVWAGIGNNSGQPYWLSWFMRVGSSGIANNQLCDVVQPTSATTDPTLQLQVKYDTTNNLYFKLESDAGASGSPFFTTANLALDTDYWFQMHLAGVNERFNQVLIYTYSAPTWSLSQTFNWDTLCEPASQGTTCSTPVATATTTGTASSGSTALTVASGTGIVVGQVVVGTGIPWLTTVTVVSGTSVTLSQNTTASLSSTSVSFYAPNTRLRTATNGTASSGSTALTVVAPTYSSITVSDPVGGTGIAEGTVVTAVSGTAITLSLPTTAALSSGSGVSFWTPPNVLGFNFGKNSSCSLTSAVTFSGWVFDPYADWGAFAPN